MKTIIDRWCPSGNHFRKPEHFRVMTNNRPARDCIDCENKKRFPQIYPDVSALDAEIGRLGGEAQRIRGVDIDRVHYKLGAVSKRLKGARK